MKDPSKTTRGSKIAQTMSILKIFKKLDYKTRNTSKIFPGNEIRLKDQSEINLTSSINNSNQCILKDLHRLKKSYNSIGSESFKIIKNIKPTLTENSISK